MSNVSILFVCLGNICRSPVAEGLFRVRAADAGVDAEVDSAGTGNWHIGEMPHPGSRAVAKAHGLDISAQRARQVQARDWFERSHIVALDTANLNDLQAARPDGATAEVLLLLQDVEGGEEDVLDPYGMDESAFEDMYVQIDAGITALLARLTT
ncbi:low molecular weight phosphotyrosine protein phosphatase [Pacificimonas sp. WHA3]|uniref:protein-tyrosine-phosphatase n=1 Tax=Pacificimonas pallii TaxID=2827236 RepID=A0ABS6S9Z8_9SPHN|nr:low molecular weight protein-tyrosine-phosphatase [Pacificimonas pallii]MBV7255188.1 low molecular weight phosphotyrosine protein phosphatase [Pacificimonas pallii]